MLQKMGGRSGSYEPVWLEGFNVDAHLEVFSKCIAMQSNQAFSVR